MKFSRSFAGYPAGAGWTYALYLRGVGSLDVTGAMVAADGDAFVVTVPASGSPSTASLAAGTYEYAERVTLAGEVYPVGAGIVTVTANLATAAAGTRQAHAEQMIPLLEAEIAARVTGTGSAHKSYTIEGRAIEKLDLTELRALLSGYRLELAALKSGGRLPPYRAVFGRPR